MKERIKNLTHLLGFFVLGVALIAVYKTFDNLQVIWDFIWRVFDILSPFIIGLGLAFLLYGPVKFFERKFGKAKARIVHKHARAFSVLCVYVALFALIAILLTFAIPAIINGVRSLITALPGYFEQFMATLDSLTKEGGLLEGLNLADAADSVYRSYILPLLNLENAPSYFKGIMDFTSSLLNVFMALIISVYMLLSRESLVRACKLVFSLFIPARPMAVLSKYIHRSCDIFYNYLYSQVIDACIVSVIMTIGCFIFRAPVPIVLGFMIGLLNMIPYFGAIIGGVAAVAISLLSGNLYGSIFLAIYIIGMQQLDANLIQPRVVGDKVGIKPIYVLLAITLGGGLFGFWGIFLGVPMIAIVQMLLIDIIRYRRRKQAARSAQEGEGSSLDTLPDLGDVDVSASAQRPDSAQAMPDKEAVADPAKPPQEAEQESPPDSPWGRMKQALAIPHRPKKAERGRHTPAEAHHGSGDAGSKGNNGEAPSRENGPEESHSGK